MSLGMDLRWIYDGFTMALRKGDEESWIKGKERGLNAKIVNLLHRPFDVKAHPAVADTRVAPHSKEGNTSHTPGQIPCLPRCIRQGTEVTLELQNRQLGKSRFDDVPNIPPGCQAIYFSDSIIKKTIFLCVPFLDLIFLVLRNTEKQSADRPPKLH